MDTASKLLIAEITGDREISRFVVDFPQTGISERAGFLSSNKVDVLICGAISQQFEQIITASGIEVYPWYCGCGDEIIAAYYNGTLQNVCFRSPGCRPHQRCQARKRSRNNRRDVSHRKGHKEDL